MKMQWRILSLLAAVMLTACGQAGALNPNVGKALTATTDEFSTMAITPMFGSDSDNNNAFPRQMPMPAPAGHKGQWLVFSNHNHTSYWDGVKPLTEAQSDVWLHNCDAMDLTDHDTMRGCQSPEFLNPPHGLIMVKGMEWNAFREKGEPIYGHAGLLGMDGYDPLPTNLSLNDMLNAATARHATIIINHPFAFNCAWQQPEPDTRAQAIEVWNGWWAAAEPLIHNDKALAWWDKALQKGEHFTAIGGTDCHGHFYQTYYKPVNMVFAETPDQAGILAGIRAGHVSISQSPTAARVFLEADPAGDGSFTAMMGDTVPHPATGTLTVRAIVLGGKGKKCVFYTAGGRVAIDDVDSDDATFTLKVKVRPGTDYVRAEVRAHPHFFFSMSAISNPVYVSNGV